MRLPTSIGWVLAGWLAGSAGAWPQEDPVETRLFRVDALTHRPRTSPGTDFSLGSDSLGQTVARTDDGSPQPEVSPEQLVDLIKKTISPASWRQNDAKIEPEGDNLSVTQRRSVQDQIAAALLHWESFVENRVILDVAIVLVAPEFLAKVFAGQFPERPVALNPELETRIFDAVREGKQAELVKTMRTTVRNGSFANFEETTSQTYVRDIDVQVDGDKIVADPVVDALTVGAFVSIRPWIDALGRAVTLDVRASLLEPDAIKERALRLQDEPAKPGTFNCPREVKIQQPHLAMHRIRTTLTAKDKETVLVGSTYRSNRNLLLLITPSTVAPREKPALEPVVDGQRRIRIYDVGLLSRSVQNFPLPRIELVSPSHGGGPLTGAQFTLEDPPVWRSAAAVAQAIRERVAPATWGEQDGAIIPVGDLLFIRQKPEILAEIDRHLTGLFASRGEMITVEVVLLGFRKGARLEWSKEIPALFRGAPFVAAEKFDLLLGEAHKAGRVRLVEQAVTTCFPGQQCLVNCLDQESYVQDFEPQVSSGGGAYDPIMGVLTSGFVLGVKPRVVPGSGQVFVDVESTFMTRQFKDVDKAIENFIHLELPRCDSLRWKTTAECEKGSYTLVAIDSRGRGDEAEEFVLFVRARRNGFK